MVSDIILTAILGSNHPSPHFTDKDSKVKMRLVPSQDLAVWANLKSSCIVPEGTVSIFSAFHVVSGRVFFFFSCTRQERYLGTPYMPARRGRDDRRMGKGERRWGLPLKKNPYFLSNHRQWLKVPSRWQDVAKDPLKPIWLGGTAPSG